ncbi:hypothetical protein MRX96_028989 [Rhipicephalus microplus]
MRETPRTARCDCADDRCERQQLARSVELVARQALVCDVRKKSTIIMNPNGFYLRLSKPQALRPDKGRFVKRWAGVCGAICYRAGELHPLQGHATGAPFGHLSFLHRVLSTCIDWLRWRLREAGLREHILMWVGTPLSADLTTVRWVQVIARGPR